MAKLSEVEGIGKANSKKLEKAGVRGTAALLRTAGDKKGRKALAKETGIDEKRILGWVNRADLMRVKGVGEEYSDLLECAGVDTVKELVRRNTANLHKKMLEVNTKKKLVRRPPSLSMVERWVAEAKKLKPAVTH